MAGLIVFVRRANETISVEVPPEATVGDLKREIAKTFPEVVANGLRLGETMLSDDGLGLADAGFSSEVTVDVEMAPLRWDPERSSERIEYEDEFTVCYWAPPEEKAGRSPDYCAEVIVGTHGWTSGRHYWEVNLKVWDGSGSGRDVIGVCTDSLQVTQIAEETCGMGSSPHCWGVGMWQSPYRKEHNKEEGSFKNAPSPQQGDRVGVLLDIDAGFVRFYLNGKFISGDDADDSTFDHLPQGETFRPAMSVGRLATKHRYRIVTGLDAPTDA